MHMIRKGQFDCPEGKAVSAAVVLFFGCLIRVLETLPDRQRLPIEHVKLKGLSVTEAAALLGMSESAVKVGIHRGLKALGKRVGTAS